MAICVVVNGPSSVGKSTLVSGLQDLASVPLLRFGADELYRMVPSQWAGGTAGARHAERGFSYREVRSEDGSPIGRRIHNGPDAVRMLYAMNAGVLGMVTSGHDVIVDGEAYEPEVNTALHRELREAAQRAAIECSIIELTADIDGLLDRQQRHAHPAGLAESQSRQGWICQDPDLHVDTGGKSADDVRRDVWEFLVQRHPRLQ
jgi:chloramphenicol 3-O-phosphotransferase